eukprot:GHVO01044597.1.p1 GENE.GHVO01044597.1~~GHVO01044597.1.p1  ORF type:complete len:122 (+),score=18.57 GHVO01044597.1:39-404(+)
MSSYPDLTYEEYLKSCVYLTSKIYALRSNGYPAFDHFIVKWYITHILLPKCKDRQQDMISNLHGRYMGALQRMYHDGIVKVEGRERIGATDVRSVSCGEWWCPAAAYIHHMHGGDIGGGGQ